MGKATSITKVTFSQNCCAKSQLFQTDDQGLKNREELVDFTRFNEISQDFTKFSKYHELLQYSTVWEILQFSLTDFRQNFRQSNVFLMKN